MKRHAVILGPALFLALFGDAVALGSAGSAVWLPARIDDGESDDGDDGRGGPGPPERPKPGGEPVWWPEFERQLREYTRARHSRGAASVQSNGDPEAIATGESDGDIGDVLPALMRARALPL